MQLKKAIEKSTGRNDGYPAVIWGIDQHVLPEYSRFFLDRSQGPCLKGRYRY